MRIGRNGLRALSGFFRRDPLRFLGYAIGIGMTVVVLYTWAFPPVTTQIPPAQPKEPARRFSETVPAEMAPALADVRTTLQNQERLLQSIDEMRRAQAYMEQQLHERDTQITTLKQTLEGQKPNGDSQLTHQQLQAMMARTANAVMQHYTPPPSTGNHAAQAAVQQRTVEPPPTMRVIAPATPPPASTEPDPPAPPSMVLPAGSLTKGRSLNGVATAGNQENLPFTIVLDEDFAGPNDSTIPLRDCHIVAHGSPETISARTKFALDTLSCVLPSGETVERDLSGWVTAADNMNGSWCEVFWNDEQIFKFFGQAAIPAALSAVLDQLQQTVTTAGAFGFVQRTGHETSNQLLGRAGNLLLDRAELFITPVVWCPQNQQVHVYVEKSVRFDGIAPAAWEHPIHTQRSLYD